MTQRSRPQLFSNALPPTVAASALAAVQFTEAHPDVPLVVPEVNPAAAFGQGKPLVFTLDCLADCQS